MHHRLSIVYGKQAIKTIKGKAKKNEFRIKGKSLKELPVMLDKIGTKLY